MRIRLIWEGKTRNPQLRALEHDYAARLKHFVELSVEDLPVGPIASKHTARENGAISAPERRLLDRLGQDYKIMLDAGGQQWTSGEFARWLEERALRGTRALAFLVGAPAGFSAAFKKQADLLLGLSRMTFTREWARVLLLEQLYRSFAILRGYPYAK